MIKRIRWDYEQGGFVGRVGLNGVLPYAMEFFSNQIQLNHGFSTIACFAVDYNSQEHMHETQMKAIDFAEKHFSDNYSDRM